MKKSEADIKNLVIYGGSFNPPHLGHREAVHTALEELQPDLLLVIPDCEPPHKQMETGSPSPEERLRLCELNFAGLDGVQISDLELRRTGKSYSYDTVLQLQEIYPGARLTLMIGTDMLLSFEEWYHFEYLLQHCTIAVLARELDDEDALRQTAEQFQNQYGADICLVQHTPLPMSSTDIRGRLRARGGTDLLQEDVYREIIRKRLYGAQPELRWLREQAYTMISAKRIAHVAGCETEAVSLAMHWGEDPEAAAEAGILHDITKGLSYKEQLKLCEKYAIICDTDELKAPKLLHARTGAAMARDLFGIPDAVYEAIRWHTTGKPDMTLLEKIIYIADYIEPTRDFPGVEAVRAIAYTDLDAAMLTGLRQTIEEIREGGTEPYIDTLNACQWLEARMNERRQ
ncbi:MAG: nicotinate (nicotinamide) nucleotide adenylyltransferase, partial [Oscillospiraceae bacterium]|nr:nicotinate (nicotinamide) nucleotide adenylyltransferase [Oscillospiraceae bacterium]